MLKYILGLSLLLLAVAGCDYEQKKDNNYIPLVPTNTPFIVGVLEATNDTVQHFPEVYVGTVSNPEGFQAKPVWTTPGIWWPITNALATRPITRNDLKREPDLKAIVSVEGPLGTTDNTTVHFINEGKGVYGDTQYELPLNGGGKYRLKVTMSDGRKYTATTIIPKLFKWTVPDSVRMNLKLGKYSNGVNYEKDISPAKFHFTVGSSVGYVVTQSNSEYDYYNYNLKKGGFLFDDRTNFLRGGASYGIYDAFYFPDKRSFNAGWEQTGDDPLRQSDHRWLSLSELNKELSKFYYSVFRSFGGEENDRWDKQDKERVKARVERDNTFLFDISNISKINKNGKTQPDEKSDAIGIFGAYSAAYRQLTVMPVRSWKPDSLGWGKQK